MTRLDQFDPNDNGKHPWATYCPGRRGNSFKVHTNRRNALNSMVHHTYWGSILYEWVNGRWQEIVRLDPERRSDHCARCGDNLLQPKRHAPNEDENTGYLRLLRNASDKLVEPLQVETVCSSCKYGY